MRVADGSIAGREHDGQSDVLLRFLRAERKEQLLSEYRVLTWYGAPGQGKTLVLRDIERELAKRRQNDPYSAPVAANRADIIRLAAGADHLFIEAAFLHRDRALAEATRHLTARAAGEIARAAGVGRVTPFHFSAHYLAESEEIAKELRDAFGAPRAKSETLG